MRRMIGWMAALGVLVACSGAEGEATVGTPTTVSERVTTDPTTTDPTTTLPPQPVQLEGVEALAGLLPFWPGDFLALEQPGSEIKPPEEDPTAAFAADDGSAYARFAQAIFGPAITEAGLIGQSSNGPDTALLFHTTDTESVVASFLADGSAWGIPDPVVTDNWTIWNLGEEVDLGARTLVRQLGRGGYLIVGNRGAPTAGWVIFSEATDGLLMSLGRSADPLMAQLAPFMTSEWQAIDGPYPAPDARTVIATCEWCEDDDLEFYLRRFSPERTARTYESLVLLRSDTDARVLLVHATEEQARINEEQLPIALAREPLTWSFHDAYEFVTLARKGNIVFIDFLRTRTRFSEASEFLRSDPFHDSTTLWTE